MPWTFSFFCLPRLKRTKKGSCTNEIGAKNVKETMVARTMHVAYTSRYKTHNEHLNHIECLFWVHLTYAIRTKKKYTAKIAILLSSAYTTTEFHSRLLALFPCWTKLMILSTYMIYFFFLFCRNIHKSSQLLSTNIEYIHYHFYRELFSSRFLSKCLRMVITSMIRTDEKKLTTKKHKMFCSKCIGYCFARSTTSIKQNQAKQTLRKYKILWNFEYSYADAAAAVGRFSNLSTFL